MEILDGKKIKMEKLEELKREIEKLNRKLGLVVIQVGEDQASTVYVNQKNKMAEMLGYNFNHIKLPSDISEIELINVINKLNVDDNVDGILVQMPVPKHINAKNIQNAIIPSKDVDGLNDVNAGKLMHNVDCLIPCTPLGIMGILEYYNISVSGKNVVIVGRSDLVGRPMATLMLNNDATVTICHSKTNNLSDYTKNADILIVAVGKSKMITADMVKDGVVIIDVGMNRVDGKLCGDVDYENVAKKASYITPVPGGVGQMTVLTLGKNVYKAYLLRK